MEAKGEGEKTRASETQKKISSKLKTVTLKMKLNSFGPRSISLWSTVTMFLLLTPVEETNFLNWSHQTVDFILAALKNILSRANNIELLEGIVCNLIVRLVRRMCTHQKEMHLIRKLGSESYVGQHVILSVSQRNAVLGENLLFMDPFDDAFPSMHDCLYMMIQLIEFLVSDYLLTWSRNECFDTRLFEERARSVLHARKVLEVLESRKGLYVLYMDQVIGDLAKQAGQVSSLQKLNPDIITNLLRC